MNREKESIDPRGAQTPSVDDCQHRGVADCPRRHYREGGVVMIGHAGCCRNEACGSFDTCSECWDEWEERHPAITREERKRPDRAIELYELERQGRLVVLPCKLGADIFRLGAKEVCAHWQTAYAEVYPDEIVIVDDSDNLIFIEDIGKSVFLTREEAEKALKEDT